MSPSELYSSAPPGAPLFGPHDRNWTWYLYHYFLIRIDNAMEKDDVDSAAAAAVVVVAVVTTIPRRRPQRPLLTTMIWVLLLL